MKTLSKLLTLFVSIGILSSCGNKESVSTTPPAATVTAAPSAVSELLNFPNTNEKIKAAPTTVDESLKTLIAKSYGAYNEKLECWVTKAIEKGDDGFYCVTVANVKIVSSTGQNLYYLWTVGNALEEDLSPREAHVYSGVFGLFVVRKDDNNYVIVSSDPMIRGGIFGNPPSDIKTYKMGANKTAWVVQRYDMHQGNAESGLGIYAPFGDKIVEIGSLQIGSSNEGACDPTDKSNECTVETISTTIKTDASNPNAPVFPLTADVTVNKKSKSTTKSFVIPFEESTGQYRVPKDYEKLFK